MKGEFEFIQYIKNSYGFNAIGDDCAVLPKNSDFDLVVTADLLVEDIDFNLEWAKPEALGHKALAISLSDIAAMGAEPTWAMLSLAVPSSLWETDFVKRFYEGWTAVAAEFNVELVGGDISRSTERFAVDSIISGDVPKGLAITRSGARPGDLVFVSGQLGGAAGGLKMLENFIGNDLTKAETAKLIERQLQPTPRVALGRELQRSKVASAMIDISDGLSSDIHHICEQSGVGAELDASLLPIDINLKSTFESDESLSLALNGGEDFELLITVPEQNLSLLTMEDLTHIGVITSNINVVGLTNKGRRTELDSSGYHHF